jgi:subtilisin family serine protease
MWGEVGKAFGAGFEVYNASNVKIGSSKVYDTQVQKGYFDTFLVIGIDTIFYNFTIETAHPLNNRPHIRMRIKNTNTNLNIVMVSGAGGGGTVHYWNVVELSNGVGNWGLAFSPFGPIAWPSDANYGIGEPASTRSAIAVAAHISETVLSNGNLNPGNRATFSSKGPTHDERTKPDVSAPGSNVVSSINSFTTESFTSVANTTFNGRTYHFAAFSGTSMASPATAGVVALMLEANPTLSPKQIMEILKATARQDNRTGLIGPAGSNLWGFGKVTATRALAMAVNTASLQHRDGKNQVLVYPNPVKDICYISLEDAPLLQAKITVTNALGQTVNSQTYSQNDAIDVSSLTPGIYFLEVKSEDRIYVCKILKE